MKRLLMLCALSVCLMALFISPLQAQILPPYYGDFTETYVPNPDGYVCDAEGIDFLPDYARNFAYDADILYNVVAESYDATGNTLIKEEVRFIGWMPASIVTDIADGGITYIPFRLWAVDEFTRSLQSDAVRYDFRFDVTYVYDRQIVLAWTLAFTCDMQTGMTDEASFTEHVILDAGDIPAELSRSQLPTTSQAGSTTRIFVQEFIVNRDGYCDLENMRFPYDYYKHFTEDTFYNYFIVAFPTDADGNDLGLQEWQTTGSAIADRRTESGYWWVNLRNEHIRLPRETASYRVVYGYTYVDLATGEKVLTWEMGMTCDVDSGVLHSLWFRADVQYPN